MEIQIRRFKESDTDYLVEILKLNDQYKYPIIDGPGAMRRVANCEAVCAELSRRGAPTVSATITEESVGFWEKKGFRRTPAFLVLKELGKSH